MILPVIFQIGGCIGKLEVHQHRHELTACILWSIWRMRNQWLFNAVATSEKEVVDCGMHEWMEYREAVRMKAKQVGSVQWP